MYKALVIMMLSISFSGFAFGAQEVSCSADKNSWGHPISCDCELYEARVGTCLSGDEEAIHIRATVQTEGGEARVLVESDDGRPYELFLAHGYLHRVLKGLAGTLVEVEVEGTLINTGGVDGIIVTKVQRVYH